MVKIIFFPLDINYETNEAGRATIKLFGRTNEGKRVCVFDKNFEPYFWVILNDKANDVKGKIEDFNEVLRTELYNKKYLGEEVEALKVFVNHPSDVPLVRKDIEEIKGVKTVNEADIPFVRRYLIDKQLSPLVSCIVEGEAIQKKEYRVDFCILAEKIEPEAEAYSKPRLLSFDIETYTSPHRYPDSKIDPIITIAFCGDNFKKMLSWKTFPTDKEIEFVDNEAALIRRFKGIIEEYKPDYLVGYYSDGFDFPYLVERAKRYKIPLKLGLDQSNVKISRRGIGSAKIEGVVHLDILSFIKKVMGGSLRLDSFGLGNVAKVLLNKEKDDLDLNKIGLVWNSGSKEIEKICEYNLQDAVLTYELCEILLPNLHEITKLVGQPIFDICRMSYGKLVEWYLVKRAFEFNEICPNKPKHGDIVTRRMHTYVGASVIEPTPGVYKNIVVFDFKGFWPSIIVAHNIDPGMLTNDKKNSYESPEVENEAGDKARYYFSYKEEGFIPKVVKDLILRRNRIKEIIKKEGKTPVMEARSYGLKTISNSLYGYFGFFGARWYSKECASSITAFGREYIKDVIEKAKDKFEVIYSDTDSIMIGLKNKTKEDAFDFLNEINKGLPSLMELEFEEFYPKGIFVMKKGESFGAKKKYGLLSEEGKIIVRGFETVRRDWSYLAKDVQMRVLDIILNKGSVKDAFQYVKNIIKDVKNKKIPISKMVMRTQLKKDLDSYNQIGPHVMVAKKLREKGIHMGVGSVINFVIAEGEGMIRDRAKSIEECEEGDYDTDYYINNQIIPAVKMIFEAVKFNTDELGTESEQRSLGSFTK